MASIGCIAAGLTYALVELIGRISSMVAYWKSLDERGWARWIEKNEAVLMCHFSLKSRRQL